MSEIDLVDKEDPAYIEQRNNRKLTADKIRQILSKVQNNPSDSAKRWVWELIQNAKDVPNQFGRVSLKIILSHDKLEFRHNGDPFSLSNIFSLIQQVSSKDSSNSDEDVTGKFGTGFISTHLLSEKIDVSGIVFHRGIHRNFETCLDRSGRTSEEMLPKIDIALEHIRNIQDDVAFPVVHNYLSIREEQSYDTVFTYLLTSEEKQKAAFLGLEDLINTLPVTLVNIPKIKSVEIIDNKDGINEIYKSDLIFEEGNIKKLKVSIKSSSRENLDLNFITYTNDSVSLAIEVDKFENPILKEINHDTPKLFRDFPLIGSNKFYHPYMLNGFRFNPTEDRDGILIHGMESFEAEENRKIIDRAFEATKAFTEWLLDFNVSNRFICAFSRLPDEKWTDFSKEWYTDLQKKYRNFLLDQPLVETDNGIINLREAMIPVYGTSTESKINFYEIVKQFVGSANVPRKDIILNWIEYTGPKDEIKSWNHEIRYELERFLADLENIRNLVSLKEKLILGVDPYQWLNKVYAFLHDERETEQFSDFKIIPNHNGEFKSIKDLYLEDSESPIAEEFLDILYIIGDNWRDDLIHREVRLTNQNVEKRDLNDASKRINEYLDSYKGDNDKLLKIVIDIIRNEGQYSTGDSFKAKLFKVANEMFGLASELRTVININGFNFDKALEKVSNIINEKIEELESLNQLAKFISKDSEAVIKWHNEYLDLLEESEKFKSQLGYKKIIPNRNGNFCSFDRIYGFGTDENPLNGKLIDILFSLNNNENWNEELIHESFSLSLESRKFEELGSKIDESLIEILKDESYNPGSILKYKQAILELINWVKANPEKSGKFLTNTFFKADELWVKFSMTNEIMNLLSDEKSLEFLQELSESNISLEKFRELMNIAKELDNLGLNGMTEILDHAKERLEIEKDFQYLKATGENIEEVFKEALKSEGVEIGINHIGIGSHDFELYNLLDATKKVFVEIKSYKQGSRNPFKFASSQIKKSVNSPNRFFVCMLERPTDNYPASVKYLKENLNYRTDINSMVSAVLMDIAAFEKIENNSEDVKLVLPLRDKPRVHINYNLMQNKVYDFKTLINDIKIQLL
jgi:hypothetical protein